MSVGNILSKLKELNDSNLVSVYVPSAKRKMSFRPLSVKQQKDLIKTGLDGALSGVTISNVINGIILENSVDKHEFLVTDKYPIILALRRQSFGSSFTVKDEESEKTFELDEILSADLNYEYPFGAIIKLSDTELEADIDIVTMKEDIDINTFQLEKIKKSKDDVISEMVGSLFIYEIVKFVTKLKVNGEEIDMKSLPIKDRLTIVENIPATLNNKILEYIQNFRKTEMEYITINGEGLPVDARLFSKE